MKSSRSKRRQKRQHNDDAESMSDEGENHVTTNRSNVKSTSRSENNRRSSASSKRRSRSSRSSNNDENGEKSSSSPRTGSGSHRRSSRHDKHEPNKERHRQKPATKLNDDTLAGLDGSHNNNFGHYHLATNKELAINVEDEDLVGGGSGAQGKKGKTLQDSDYSIQLGSYNVEPISTYALVLGDMFTGTQSKSSSLWRSTKGRNTQPGNRATQGNRNQSREVEELYVESMTTGKFRKITFALDELGRRVAQGTDQQQIGIKSHSPEALRMVMIKATSLVDSFFLFCEGILSGAAIFQLVVVYQITDPETFIQIYGPLALEIRRVFYFLSTLAFVGVCDKYNVESSQEIHWFARPTRERSELLLYVLFYFISLVFSLLAGPIADEMGNTYRARADNSDAWIAELLRSPTFDVDQWKLYITVRVVFAVLGWVLLCRDMHRDLFRGRQRLDHIEQLTQHMEKAQLHVRLLEGKGLEDLGIKQLQELEKSQRVGLEETQLQLRLRNQAA